MKALCTTIALCAACLVPTAVDAVEWETPPPPPAKVISNGEAFRRIQESGKPWYENPQTGRVHVQSGPFDLYYGTTVTVPKDFKRQIINARGRTVRGYYESKERRRRNN